VGAESFLVANLHLTSAHLECVLTSGRAATVLAGGEPIGLFFEGTGSLQYDSADPIEAPVVTFVLKKNTGLTPEKTEKGTRIRDTFGRILWLAPGQPQPDLGRQTRASLEASFTQEREKFRRTAIRPFSHAFATQRLDAPDAPTVRAEIDGGKETLVYERESVEDPSERLIQLHSSPSNDPELRKQLWPLTLSHQLLGRDRRDPAPPRFVLTDVDVQLSASAGDDARLSVIETLVPQRVPQSVFRFDLDRTIYKQVGNNLATRTERVEKVTDSAGRSLSFAHQNDELLIQLAEPAAPDVPIKVRFDIDGDFLIRPGGDSYWELGGDWFPQPPLGGQYYTMHTLVRVKKPFIPFAPGATIRRAEEGDENVLETRVDKPVQFATVLAGKYDMQEEVRHGVTIRVATYALTNRRAMKQLTDLADTIINYYVEFLGAFPFPEFNILEINSYGFGQAPPATMYITKEAFNPIMGEENQLFSQGINERFAHEIAHQYWGHVVKMPSLEEQWITESFAEYTAAVFLKASRGDAIYRSLYNHWKTRASYASSAAPIPLANRARVVDDFVTSFSIRVGLLYNKGPVLLAALHRELGDDKFFMFLKSYQKSFRWKFGSTKMMVGLLQFMTQKDFGPFFEANYWATGMPKD